MTFMPKFTQTSIALSHDTHVNLETELLRDRSRECLSLFLIDNDLVSTGFAGDEYVQLGAVYKARLEKELTVLADNDFCGYFLIVADYVQWAKANDIAVGPGRGSGPSSLVGFLLGITTVDPIKYALPFERFINTDRMPGRSKPLFPDFDLDFCDERCGEVVAYIQKKYGVDRVAQISTEDAVPLPTRLVIGDRPLSELVPLYPNPESGFPAAKMTIVQIANAGLVQFNVINQKALTVNQRAIKDRGLSSSVVENLPLDDAAVYDLLCSGEESNIVELDGAEYRNTLVTVKPENFDQLCAVVALRFPKLKSITPSYIQRKTNKNVVTYFLPALEQFTKETFGLILYQEQIMHIAHAVAGFSMAQSDLFRRASQKSNDQLTKTFQKPFVDGAMNFGLSKEESLGLFDYLAKSSVSAMNKSHAVAFAMLAYQSAWVKLQ